MSNNSGFRSGNVVIRGNNKGNSGLEINSFADIWARGVAPTCPSGRAQIKTNAQGGANGRMRISVLEEDISLASATSVDSTNNLLPANSLILEIIAQPLSDFVSTATYSLGDAAGSGAPTRFGTGMSNVTVAAGAAYASAHWTGTVAIRQVAAAKLRVKPDAHGTGRLRVQVFYISFLGGQS